MRILVFLCAFSAVLAGNRSSGQTPVVINEIMYAPPPGKTEWIELANSGSDTADVTGWVVHDATTARPAIPGARVVIPPGGFLVLARDASLVDDFPGLEERLIVMDRLPSLNNTGDRLALLDAAGAVMDSLAYQTAWGGADGESLERRDARGASTDPVNWGACIDAARATPGRANSIARVDRDLEASAITAGPGGAELLVRNRGHASSDAAAATLALDADDDGFDDPGEGLGAVAVPVLAPGDSMTAHFVADLGNRGRVRLLAAVSWPRDERPSNNTLAAVWCSPLAPGVLTVNEIMYAPLAGDAEWVEYVNTGATTIDLRAASLANRPATDGTRSVVPLPDTGMRITPGAYLVIASDSGVVRRHGGLAPPAAGALVVVLGRASLNLRNDGDDVVLRDACGATIDSVRFDPAWHNPNVPGTEGRSLERINPKAAPGERANWSTSADPSGATPGRRNSIHTELPAVGTGAAHLVITPNPFSPDGDGHEDFCAIGYTLPGVVSHFRLRVFDAAGRMVRTLVAGAPAGGSGSVVWDGLDDAGLRLRVGMYIVLLEAVDAASGGVTTLKAVAVVATRL